MKELGRANTEDNKAVLDVIECQCGFHIGIDETYLEQVKQFVSISCPSCDENIVWNWTE